MRATAARSGELACTTAGHYTLHIIYLLHYISMDDDDNDDDDCPARVRGVLYPHQEVRRRDHPERGGERRRFGSHQTAHRGDVHEAYNI